jgi:hypothetical protein
LGVVIMSPPQFKLREANFRCYARRKVCMIV